MQEEIKKELIGRLIPPSELSNSDYHQMAGISSTGLRQALKDPKLYFNKDKLLRMASPSLELGEAVHKALLEPLSFNANDYSLTPQQRQKNAVMINNGRVMFSYILDKTLNEHSIFVKDNGFIRKVRMDAYDRDKGIIYDLKTTRYGTPNSFIKDAYDLGYHLQAAYYLDTIKMAGLRANAFAFLVIPNESPCEPFAVQLTDRFIEEGRAMYSEVISRIIEFNSGDSVFFHQGDLPSWRLAQLGLN